MATAWTNHSIAFNSRNKAEAALAYTYDRSNSLYGVRTNENTLNTYDVQASYIRTFNQQHTLRAGATHNGFLTSNTLGLKDSIYIDDIETEAYDFTTGIFAEYTYKIDSILRINARMNADWSNWFGFFYASEVSIDYFPYKSLLINANVLRSKKTNRRIRKQQSSIDVIKASDNRLSIRQRAKMELQPVCYTEIQALRQGFFRHG
ncbi:MAG: hypothetical protein IKC96_03705 [Paludibacteraceae bacterium]|nr:hypothetical protein [Paludibacteraceae bacterium]